MYLQIKEHEYGLISEAKFYILTSALIQKSGRYCGKGDLYKMIAVKYKECMIDTNGRFPGIGSLSYLEENHLFFPYIYIYICDFMRCLPKWCLIYKYLSQHLLLFHRMQ